jgi:type I restriction enzyme R subunit
MRQALVNENPEQVQKNRKYVMKITGDDAEGKAELDNFIDPEQAYPVIATTSELMSTGVDAVTCKLIVLDQNIKSMTKFKQVIGRGTRINEDYNKLWFTIMDFKKATELFADPDFDGDAEVIYNPSPGDPTVEPGDGEDGEGGDGTDPSGKDDDDGDGISERPPKYVVKGISVTVVSERVQYMGSDGKLITESLKEYTSKTVKQEFATLNDFLRKWNSADQKQAVIKELEEQGVIWQALADEVGKEYGAFDLICHVVYGQPPLSRQERADNVRKRDVFTKYGEQARKVLEALLDKYADEGIAPLEDISVLTVQPFNTMGRPIEIIKGFGGKAQYQQAVKELEQVLYDSAANA